MTQKEIKGGGKREREGVKKEEGEREGGRGECEERAFQ